MEGFNESSASFADYTALSRLEHLPLDALSRLAGFLDTPSILTLRQVSTHFLVLDSLAPIWRDRMIDLVGKEWMHQNTVLKERFGVLQNIHSFMSISHKPIIHGTGEEEKEGEDEHLELPGGGMKETAEEKEEEEKEEEEESWMFDAVVGDPSWFHIFMETWSSSWTLRWLLARLKLQREVMGDVLSRGVMSCVVEKTHSVLQLHGNRMGDFRYGEEIRRPPPHSPAVPHAPSYHHQPQLFPTVDQWKLRHGQTKGAGPYSASPLGPIASGDRILSACFHCTSGLFAYINGRNQLLFANDIGKHERSVFKSARLEPYYVSPQQKIISVEIVHPNLLPSRPIGKQTWLDGLTAATSPSGADDIRSKMLGRQFSPASQKPSKKAGKRGKGGKRGKKSSDHLDIRVEKRSSRRKTRNTPVRRQMDDSNDDQMNVIAEMERTDGVDDESDEDVNKDEDEFENEEQMNEDEDESESEHDDEEDEDDIGDGAKRGRSCDEEKPLLLICGEGVIIYDPWKGKVVSFFTAREIGVGPVGHAYIFHLHVGIEQQSRLRNQRPTIIEEHIADSKDKETLTAWATRNKSSVARMILLVCAHADGIISIWDMRNAQCVQYLFTRSARIAKIELKWEPMLRLVVTFDDHSSSQSIWSCTLTPFLPTSESEKTSHSSSVRYRDGRSSTVRSILSSEALFDEDVFQKDKTGSVPRISHAIDSYSWEISFSYMSPVLSIGKRTKTMEDYGSIEDHIKSTAILSKILPDLLHTDTLERSHIQSLLEDDVVGAMQDEEAHHRREDDWIFKDIADCLLMLPLEPLPAVIKRLEGSMSLIQSKKSYHHAADVFVSIAMKHTGCCLLIFSAADAVLKKMDDIEQLQFENAIFSSLHQLMEAVMTGRDESLMSAEFSSSSSLYSSTSDSSSLSAKQILSISYVVVASMIHEHEWKNKVSKSLLELLNSWIPSKEEATIDGVIDVVEEFGWIFEKRKRMPLILQRLMFISITTYLLVAYGVAGPQLGSLVAAADLTIRKSMELEYVKKHVFVHSICQKTRELFQNVSENPTFPTSELIQWHVGFGRSFGRSLFGQWMHSLYKDRIMGTLSSFPKRRKFHILRSSLSLLQSGGTLSLTAIQNQTSTKIEVTERSVQSRPRHSPSPATSSSLSPGETERDVEPESGGKRDKKRKANKQPKRSKRSGRSASSSSRRGDDKDISEETATSTTSTAQSGASTTPTRSFSERGRTRSRSRSDSTGKDVLLCVIEGKRNSDIRLAECLILGAIAASIDCKWPKVSQHIISIEDYVSEMSDVSSLHNTYVNFSERWIAFPSSIRHRKIDRRLLTLRHRDSRPGHALGDWVQMDADLPDLVDAGRSGAQFVAAVDGDKSGTAVNFGHFERSNLHQELLKFMGRVSKEVGVIESDVRWKCQLRVGKMNFINVPRELRRGCATSLFVLPSLLQKSDSIWKRFPKDHITLRKTFDQSLKWNTLNNVVEHALRSRFSVTPGLNVDVSVHFVDRVDHSGGVITIRPQWAAGLDPYRFIVDVFKGNVAEFSTSYVHGDRTILDSKVQVDVMPVLLHAIINVEEEGTMEMHDVSGEGARDSDLVDFVKRLVSLNQEMFPQVRSGAFVTIETEEMIVTDAMPSGQMRGIPKSFSLLVTPRSSRFLCEKMHLSKRLSLMEDVSPPRRREDKTIEESSGDDLEDKRSKADSIPLVIDVIERLEEYGPLRENYFELIMHPKTYVMDVSSSSLNVISQLCVRMIALVESFVVKSLH